MFIVDKNPKSISAESYRSLRTNIQYSSFDTKYRTIVVTSSEPGEGKSTTSGNLAAVFAQDGKMTILIDCDLRKPSIHKKMNISNQVGLSDVIIGKEKIEYAVHKESETFHILTSGKIPPNPSEMLGSKRMEHLLETLKESYDVIILDTPPVHAVTDAQILSTKVDGTVLVVRAGRTKKDSVVDAKNLLDKVGANLIGTVLNAVEDSKGKYYYYYGTK